MTVCVKHSFVALSLALKYIQVKKSYQSLLIDNQGKYQINTVPWMMSISFVKACYNAELGQ